MSTQQSAKSLVLVVGAGASKEVNLPTGAELKTQIAQLLDIKYEDGFRRSSGDSLIDRAFHLVARSFEAPLTENINPLLHAAWRIRDAIPQAISIDNFIDSHRTDTTIALCGKLGIARAILAAEQESTLFVDPRNIYNKINFSATQSTWLNSFFQLVTENCQYEDLPTRLAKVAIICFNYDRCIEHYLHASLQNYYGVKPDAATEVLSHLEIHHPYGTVGSLPWQDPRHGFDFGASPSPEKLLDLSKALRTFTEGVDPAQSDIEGIRSTLALGKRIVFLGFAFHRLNLELLFPTDSPDREPRSCQVFATAMGISVWDCKSITNELNARTSISPKHISLDSGLTCSDLFREYWRSLSIQ
jgi:hypothetical protein